MPQDREVRRQARGQRRMTEILDAAADVFAHVGYEAATTNAIAAQAGISPGSLYQFYANKEAIAEALAERFGSQMRQAHTRAFDLTGVAQASLEELLDRTVDPLVAFNVANPGLKALFARTDMPVKLAAAIQPLHDAVSERVRAIVDARAAGLAPAEQARIALVCLYIVKALMPLIVAACGDERRALIGELKTVLRAYLEPTLAESANPAGQ